MNFTGIVPDKRQQFLTWKLVTNAIGKSRKWPSNIRCLFWKSDLSYSACIRLAAFTFVNNLDVVLLELWFLVSKTSKLSANETIRWYKIFTKSKEKYNFVTYEVKRDCAVRVNGLVVNPFGHTLDENRLDAITYV